MTGKTIPPQGGFIRILFSLLVLAALFWIANPLEALARLSGVVLPIILILFAGFAGVILLNGIAEWWLFRTFSHLTLEKVLRNYVYSWSTELFLPGKLGMFSIAYFLREEKIEIGKSVAVVLLTKFSTLILLLLLGVGGLFYYHLDARWWMYGALAATGMIVAYGLFFTEYGRTLLKRYILRDRAPLFSGFSHVLGNLSQNPLRLLGLGIILFAGLSVNALAVQNVFIQGGYPLGFLPVLSVVSLVTLMGLIPITFNGLGLKEAVLVTLMIPLGVPADVALALGALSTTVGYLIGFGIGLFMVQKIPIGEVEGWLRARRPA